MNSTVRLGYELRTGDPVEIPVRHLAVTGQTQEAGKTTTLEALVARSGRPAIAFVTKRGEGAFREGQRIPPYFRERADWQFVASILEATMREKMRFERAWIMRASKGAKTLADVQRNVKGAMEKARGLSADVYLTLDHYLDIVVPQIARLGDTMAGGEAMRHLGAGLNIMQLAAFSTEMQALIIRSVLEWVYQEGQGIITIIPEAWEFLPQRRSSPVLLAAEELIRKGAASQNYLWLDSQDLAAVNKAVLKSVIVWLLGVQREANEVKRTLEHIPAGTPKPTLSEVMGLGVGQFIACWGRFVKRVYVQPVWLDEPAAATVAYEGLRAAPLSVSRSHAPTTEEMEEAAQALQDEVQRQEADEMDRQERERYEQQIVKLTTRAEKTEDEVRRLVERLEQYAEVERAIGTLRTILVRGVVATPNGAVDQEQLIAEVLRRLPASGGTVYQVAPVEKLRKDYQQQEVDRLLAWIRELPELERKILGLVETTEGRTGQQKLAERLGRSFGGNARVTFVAALRRLASAQAVDIEERHGVAKRLKVKIAEDLAIYQASEQEVEATYQTIMATMAGAPV